MRIPNPFQETLLSGGFGECKGLSVVYIDFFGFSRYEQSHGAEACEYALETFKRILAAALAGNSSPWRGAKAYHVFDDGFALLFPGVVLDGTGPGAVQRFLMVLENDLKMAMERVHLPSLRLRSGTVSSAAAHGEVPGSSSPYRLIAEAARAARRQTDSVPPDLVQELQRLMQSDEIAIHYQPIWELAGESVLGWEGLARGPRQSEFRNPALLFHTAERTGHLLEVERHCRNKAIRGADIASDQLLFLNISPNILSEPSFRQGETLKVVREKGLLPEQIVFEITENQAIRDYPAFQQLILHYKEQGYQIAIDDVGAGHSGLVTLMRLKPDYVKIDMNMIRGLEQDRTKQDIVRAIRHISEGFAGKVIAEGIETREELACVIRCGIEYGQGYLLGKPRASVSRSSGKVR